jgi:hypothetical protein
MTSQIDNRYPMDTYEHAQASMRQATWDHSAGKISDTVYALVKFKLQTRINQVKKQELFGSAAKIKTRYDEQAKPGRAVPPSPRPQRFGRRSG